MESLEWLADNSRYTKQFADYVGKLCRNMTNKAVAETLRLAKYDGENNIRNSVITSPGHAIAPWNTFDVASRPLILKGVMNSTGKIVIEYNQGTETIYQNGYPNETSIIQHDRAGKPVSVVKGFVFDADSYLVGLKHPFGMETRGYNCRGWPQHADRPEFDPRLPHYIYDAERNANGWDLRTIEGNSTTTVGVIHPSD